MKKKLIKFKQKILLKINKNIFKLFLSPYLAVLFLLIFLPSLLILIYSIISFNVNSSVFEINFKNFIVFFSNLNFLKTLFFSIGLALLASFFAAIISYPIAYILAFFKSKIIKNNIYFIISLPIWINMLLKVIGLQTIFNLLSFHHNYLIGTWYSIVIAMTYMFLPFAILPIYNSLNKINKNYINASYDLGANKFKTFWKITFRSSISGIIIAITLVIIQASTSLIVVKYFGAGKINLISKIIESYFFQGTNFGFGATISIVLIFFILIILGINKLINSKFEIKQK